MISMPRASDSGDSGHASHNGIPDTAFRTQHGVGITIRPISELDPHGLLTRCVRFAPASHPANGNTRYRPARYGFDRAGLTPAGLHQEVSLAHRSSPSSALIPARAECGHNRTYCLVLQSDRSRSPLPESWASYFGWRLAALIRTPLVTPRPSRGGFRHAAFDRLLQQRPAGVGTSNVSQWAPDAAHAAYA